MTAPTCGPSSLVRRMRLVGEAHEQRIGRRLFDAHAQAKTRLQGVNAVRLGEHLVVHRILAIEAHAVVHDQLAIAQRAQQVAAIALDTALIQPRHETRREFGAHHQPTPELVATQHLHPWVGRIVDLHQVFVVQCADRFRRLGRSGCSSASCDVHGCTSVAGGRMPGATARSTCTSLCGGDRALATCFGHGVRCSIVLPWWATWPCGTPGSISTDVIAIAPATSSLKKLTWSSSRCNASAYSNGR